MNTLARFLGGFQRSQGARPALPVSRRSARGAPSRAERQTGGLVDPQGGTRVVFDIDGTREAAPQSLLPIAS